MRTPRVFLLLGLTLLLAAVGRPPAQASAAPPRGAPEAGPTAPLGQSTGGAAPKLDVQVLVKNLDTPWEIAFAPDGRMFVTERPGRIRIIKDGQLQPDPWLTP